MTCSRRLRALALTACVVGVAALTSCADLSYGANFDYPREPPLLAGATVIAQAKGSDDDDPMRGREVVIDIGSARPAELVEFYRKQFPSVAGWRPGAPDPDNGGDDLLCLVSHSDKRFDEYVEIYPYHRRTNGYPDDRRTNSATPHRYLASVSRLYVPERGERTANRCGLARGWFPDL